jgi:hypothetical protein
MQELKLKIQEVKLRILILVKYYTRAPIGYKL